jgi:hypothetical protein
VVRHQRPSAKISNVFRIFGLQFPEKKMGDGLKIQKRLLCLCWQLSLAPLLLRTTDMAVAPTRGAAFH